jgi:hypothetical protein
MMPTTVSNDMNDNHPTGDLAEMMLMTDLMKLEGGTWKTKSRAGRPGSLRVGIGRHPGESRQLLAGRCRLSLRISTRLKSLL